MRDISIGRIFRAFLWIGLTGIGGGRIAYLYDDLVERRRWLTRDEFLPGFALCNLLPGPTFTNISVFLGQNLRGRAGAILGPLGVLLPGVVSILILGAVYFSFGMSPALNAVLRGMGAAVAGFICVITAKMTRGVFQGRGRSGIWIAAVTFIAVGLFRLNTFLVVFVTGAISLWVHRPRQEAQQPAVEGAP